MAKSDEKILRLYIQSSYKKESRTVSFTVEKSYRKTVVDLDFGIHKDLSNTLKLYSLQPWMSLFPIDKSSCLPHWRHCILSNDKHISHSTKIDPYLKVPYPNYFHSYSCLNMLEISKLYDSTVPKQLLVIFKANLNSIKVFVLKMCYDQCLQTAKIAMSPSCFF